MTTLKEVTSYLQKLAPLSYAGNWDNVGLLVEPSVGQANHAISTILLTNDLTSKVVNEATTLNANMIISYHPPIFSGWKRITTADTKQKIILQCIENKIAVYSPHTSFDCSRNGVNDWFINSILPVSEKSQDFPFILASDNDSSVGYGRSCCLKTPLKISQVIENVKAATQLAHLNVAVGYGHSLDTQISSISVCVGSGASVFKKQRCDVFVSGEMSHHDVLEKVENGSTVILTHHTNCERGFLKEILKYAWCLSSCFIIREERNLRATFK